MPQMRVFVSYSRHDHAVIVPIVKLLRLGKDPRLVFLDADSIPAGKRWRLEIAKAIGAAEYLVLFWCDHSVKSVEVEREYRAALDAQKAVVPVLLDGTPLPEELAAFQWIDMSIWGVGTHIAPPQTASTKDAADERVNEIFEAAERASDPVIRAMGLVGSPPRDVKAIGTIAREIQRRLVSLVDERPSSNS